MVNHRSWEPDRISHSPEPGEWISFSMTHSKTKYPGDFLKSHINLFFQIPFLKVNVFPFFAFSFFF